MQCWVVLKPGLMRDTLLNRKAGWHPAPLIRMKILSIDHVQIAMPAGDEEKARAFYIELLGFTEIPKPAELARRGGAWFQSGDVQLHLGVESDFRPARKAHPAFVVQNLATLIAAVQAAGYETDTSQPPLDGYKRAHVFDPFGNRIELMEKL
jgi:catechol 2,3-dioxygenase-like lactoylglutathione lyase family enzyme